ncbi:hypothetical protein L6452_05877 [Arctium lappa]|uniref:Uncharacterized protein n=1 Tax=Arctium lappa TaxID=4217 RepID=A0ACB9EH06_ARCLA|nr:hypothetical protein L6452_05877 [Arctium lappa]
MLVPFLVPINVLSFSLPSVFSVSSDDMMGQSFASLVPTVAAADEDYIRTRPYQHIPQLNSYSFGRSVVKTWTAKHVIEISLFTYPESKA